MTFNYSYLINRSRKVLFKLASMRGEHSYTKAEKLLLQYPMEVIQTVSTIMILGRDYYYDGAVKPVRKPAHVFKEYAQEYWIADPKMKEGEVEYVTGNRYMADYLQAGITVLGIK